MSDWHIFKKSDGNGDIKPHNYIAKLPPPPAWRNFAVRADHQKRAESYRPSDEEIEMVNAALYLRRPLLITGNPGSGKSSLAYAVARQLNLGKVLWWPINSRTMLRDGLYEYDALGRLRDLNIEKLRHEIHGWNETAAGGGGSSVDETETSAENAAASKNEEAPKSAKTLDITKSPAEQIGRYIRLGPLGTALYGGEKPRVLLIDEIDKSDIDLPNDLLHVLEEGAFDIPELKRLTPDIEVNGKANIDVKVWPSDVDDASEMVTIPKGRVQCKTFPFVILTSNGERELPPAFKRRCLRLNIDDPKGDRLRDIVSAHIKEAEAASAVDEVKHAKPVKLSEDVEKIVIDFENRREGQLLATDQLLNAVYLITRLTSPEGEERDRILEVVLRELRRK